MYGKTIPHLTINKKPAPYPVVNEREIRGAAGIMLVIGLPTFVYVLLTQNFAPMFVVVPIFWVEFFLKSIFQPHWSIFGALARPVVQKQIPEYVGAIQKRFAWSLGLGLASMMMVGPVFLGVRGWLPLIICVLCLFFLWLESVFGICVGCHIYRWLLDKKIIKEPKVRAACPGGVCSIPKK